MFYFWLPPPSTERRGHRDSRKIPPGPKKDNKKHHVAACRAAIRGLVRSQPGFASAVTAPRSAGRSGHLRHTLWNGREQPAGGRPSVTPAQSGKTPDVPGFTGILPGRFQWKSAAYSHIPRGEYSPGRQPCRDTPKTCGSKAPAAHSLPKVGRTTARCLMGLQPASGASRQACGKGPHGLRPIGVASHCVPSCLPGRQALAEKQAH